MGARHRATVRAKHWPHWRTFSGRPCQLKWDTTTWECPTRRRKLRKGFLPARSSVCRSSLCSSLWRQYESWTLPFSVLLGVPIAVFGAFLTLYLRHLDNDVYAQIGLVMLIGLSAKNAILIVEFAKMEYDSGKTLIDAALTGARLRLRPILMTAFAFILGCVPLWVAT